jgi:hypothetical protein
LNILWLLVGAQVVAVLVAAAVLVVYFKPHRLPWLQVLR